MKTTNFATYGKQKLTCGVSIAVGKPRFIKVPMEIKAFAPTWDLLNRYRNDKIDEAQYIIEYKEMLSKLDAHGFIKQIKETCGKSEPIFMCHCGKNDFCHRHIFAEWLQGSGYAITEVGFEDYTVKDGFLIKPSKPAQGSLFE